MGTSKSDLFAEIDSHERLWGQTWVQDSIYKLPWESYSDFKNIIGYKYR